jgi:hypothetical protein
VLGFSGCSGRYSRWCVICRGLVVNGNCACAVVMAEVNDVAAIERGSMCAEDVQRLWSSPLDLERGDNWRDLCCCGFDNSNARLQYNGDFIVATTIRDLVCVFLHPSARCAGCTILLSNGSIVMIVLSLWCWWGVQAANEVRLSWRGQRRKSPTSHSRWRSTGQVESSPKVLPH